MKTTIIKTFVVLACMMMGLTSIARGQVYSNGYYYYHSETSDGMLIIKFDGRKAILRYSTVIPCEERIVRSHLKEDPNYFEKDFTGSYTGGLSQRIFEYYSEKNGYTIYTCIYKSNSGARMTAWGIQPTYTEDKVHIAVSSDKQTVLYWYETDNGKRKFIKVDKSHYLPKDDFFDE